MLDIDKLYDKVSKENPSRDELLEIIDMVDNTNSFGNSSFSVDDLFLKISQSKHITDDMIKYMYDVQVENYWGSETHTPKMLNAGSKRLFDTLWGTENKYGKWIKLFRSKHADTDQLENFYNNVVKNKDRGVSKKWLEEIKLSVLEHPNCPEKIQNTNLKKRESIEALAKIPRPSNKALHAIHQFLYYPGKMANDQIMFNFLKHSTLEWKTIADMIELKAHLENIFGGIMTMSTKRKEAILEFCKRPETPDSVKNFLYEQTGDNDYLTDELKELFIF